MDEGRRENSRTPASIPTGEQTDAGPDLWFELHPVCHFPAAHFEAPKRKDCLTQVSALRQTPLRSTKLQQPQGRHQRAEGRLSGYFLAVHCEECLTSFQEQLPLIAAKRSGADVLALLHTDQPQINNCNFIKTRLVWYPLPDDGEVQHHLAKASKHQLISVEFCTPAFWQEGIPACLQKSCNDSKARLRKNGWELARLPSSHRSLAGVKDPCLTFTIKILAVCRISGWHQH